MVRWGGSSLLLCLFCSLSVYRVNSFHSRDAKPVATASGQALNRNSSSPPKPAGSTGSDPFCLISKERFRKGCPNTLKAHEHGTECAGLAREYLACRGRACKPEREQVLACIRMYRPRKDWMTVGRASKCQPVLNEYNICRKKLAFKPVVLPGPRKVVPPVPARLNVDTKSVEQNKNGSFSVAAWLNVLREYDPKATDDDVDAIAIKQRLKIDKSPSHSDVPRMVPPQLEAGQIEGGKFPHQDVAHRLRATASRADLRVRHALAVFGNHSRRRSQMYQDSDNSTLEELKALSGCCNNSKEGKESADNWVRLHDVDGGNKSLWWNPRTDTTYEGASPEEPEDTDTPNSVAHFSPDPRQTKEMTLPPINYQIDPEHLQAGKAKKDFEERLSKYDHPKPE